jgi:hypothetical protein
MYACYHYGEQQRDLSRRSGTRHGCSSDKIFAENTNKIFVNSGLTNSLSAELDVKTKARVLYRCSLLF